MISPTLQRILWLGAITLVVAIVALAISRRHADGGGERVPGGVSVPGTENGYYTARAAPYGPTASHRRTACGEPFLAKTEGVAHPTLPCGVKLYLHFHGRDVLTQVVDRGPRVPGRDFEVTKALANRIGLHGAQTINWRFAR